MKEDQLIDRIVVEIKAPRGYTLATEQVANQLRSIADEIDEGMKGNNYTDQMPYKEESFEVLWERENMSYGFRMGDKSLICQHYYGSEAKPIVISRETIAKIVEWRKMMYEKDGDDMKYTDGELNEDAEVIMDSIVEQWKEQSQ